MKKLLVFAAMCATIFGATTLALAAPDGNSGFNGVFNNDDNAQTNATGLSYYNIKIGLRFGGTITMPKYAGIVTMQSNDGSGTPIDYTVSSSRGWYSWSFGMFIRYRFGIIAAQVERTQGYAILGDGTELFFTQQQFALPIWFHVDLLVFTFHVGIEPVWYIAKAFIKVDKSDTSGYKNDDFISHDDIVGSYNNMAINIPVGFSLFNMFEFTYHLNIVNPINPDKVFSLQNSYFSLQIRIPLFKIRGGVRQGCS